MDLHRHHPRLETSAVAPFLAMKFAGTVFVLGTLSVLYRFRERMGIAIAAGLATFQTILLAFLMYG
jgi:hypothetical protein